MERARVPCPAWVEAFKTKGCDGVPRYFRERDMTVRVETLHVHPAAPAAAAASGSSFYTAMRVLPRRKREAVYAVYDFCRAVDDIADGPEIRTLRLRALAQWRADVHAMFADAPPARLHALAESVHAFDLQREDFLAIIDGVEMDAAADIVAPDLTRLDLYCDRVASAVGRLCVRVFGMPGRDGLTLAHHLGRALQLTNILRDLDDDARIGRLYLPREALLAAGITETSAAAVLAHPALGAACAALARRARDHFTVATGLMARYPMRIVRTPLLMAKIYTDILGRLMARGFAPPRHPVKAGRAALVWTVLRYGLV